LKFAEDGHRYKKENEKGNGIDNGAYDIRIDALHEENCQE
jgi:hypothetical protein